MNNDALRRRVEQERRARAWSVRQAAQKGGVSNTAWSEWEAGKRPIGPRVRDGVAKAFEWPADWPENPPPVGTEPQIAVIASSIARRIEDLEDRSSRVEELAGEVAELRARVAELETVIVITDERFARAADTGRAAKVTGLTTRPRPDGEDD